MNREHFFLSYVTVYQFCITDDIILSLQILIID